MDEKLALSLSFAGGSIVWLTRANLWIFGGYKKANAEDKEDACLLANDRLWPILF